MKMDSFSFKNVWIGCHRFTHKHPVAPGFPPPQTGCRSFVQSSLQLPTDVMSHFLLTGSQWKVPGLTSSPCVLLTVCVCPFYCFLDPKSPLSVSFSLSLNSNHTWDMSWSPIFLKRLPWRLHRPSLIPFSSGSPFKHSCSGQPGFPA